MCNKDNNNFWIVYADLMAGLLFVFILLLSAIVLKYIFTQNELKNEQKHLDESKALIISKDELLSSLNQELSRLNIVLNDELNKNKEADEYIKELLFTLDENTKNKDELLKNIDEKDAKILILLKSLEDNELKIKDKDNKLNELANELSNFKLEYNKLKNNKTRLIQALQNKLSNDILINLNSGSISLNANILFDSAEFNIKDEAKAELKKTLSNYFDAILSSPEILANIDSIIIEGHTDSVGGFTYNLELSQKRALEIMKFINSFYKDKRLEKLLTAVGKSYNELKYKDGVEDKQASRRIEIKLQFSNEAAIKEFESVITKDLGENSNN
ncbi:OmpA domain-containing protein [Campylobacter sp. RM5004]|uniref:OmpA family protein n=1 Tax=Campylobacter sp. RM5004 TaxID=1660078 RepID=UPI001EFBDA16|nr:OmpA family protein [Campylobacter sp. RM5004]ULO01002.1 OmpA domain-containing protein [Campylobacter sp. RM5004]